MCGEIVDLERCRRRRVRRQRILQIRHIEWEENVRGKQQQRKTFRHRSQWHNEVQVVFFQRVSVRFIIRWLVSSKRRLLYWRLRHSQHSVSECFSLRVGIRLTTARGEKVYRYTASKGWSQDSRGGPILTIRRPSHLPSNWPLFDDRHYSHLLLRHLKNSESYARRAIGQFTVHICSWFAAPFVGFRIQHRYVTRRKL